MGDDLQKGLESMQLGLVCNCVSRLRILSSYTNVAQGGGASDFRIIPGHPGISPDVV